MRCGGKVEPEVVMEAGGNGDCFRLVTRAAEEGGNTGAEQITEV